MKIEDRARFWWGWLGHRFKREICDVSRVCVCVCVADRRIRQWIISNKIRFDRQYENTPEIR